KLAQARPVARPGGVRADKARRAGADRALLASRRAGEADKPVDSLRAFVEFGHEGDADVAASRIEALGVAAEIAPRQHAYGFLCVESLREACVVARNLRPQIKRGVGLLRG